MKSSFQYSMILVGLAFIISSCSTSRTVVIPARNQPTKWDKGSAVASDTSRNLKGDVKVHAVSHSVQFMLHLVNKGIQSVLIDPSKIFTIQTNSADMTSTVFCRDNEREIFKTQQTPPSSGPSVGAIVGIGIVAALLVGAVYVATKDNHSTERKQNVKSKEHHEPNPYKGYDSYRRYNEPRDCGGSSQVPIYQPSPLQLELLKKHTLEPGMEMKGIVEVGLMDEVKKLVLVVPGADSLDVLHFGYQVQTITE